MTRPLAAPGRRLRAGLLAAGILLVTAGAAVLLLAPDSPLRLWGAAALLLPGAALLGICGALALRAARAGQAPGPRWSGAAGDEQPSRLPRFNGNLVQALVPQRPAVQWGSEVFDAIEWRRFQAVCEALLAQDGTLVQSRQRPDAAIGLEDMRELQAAMAARHLSRGAYATTGRFSDEALAFARTHGITPLDGPALLALIDRQPPARQQALLGIAYEGDYWRPSCPGCGAKMVQHVPATGGAASWVCASEPPCPG
jgi:restriction system protein